MDISADGTKPLPPGFHARYTTSALIFDTVSVVSIAPPKSIVVVVMLSFCS